MKSNVELNSPVRRIQISVNSASRASGSASLEKIIPMFEKRIEKRCPARFVPEKAELVINLAVDQSIGRQGYRIERTGEQSVCISGDGPMGLMYGLGKFLHTSKYTNDGLVPSDSFGIFIPTNQMRGIQLDTHFCNYYHMAPAEELAEYVEDLAFWGVNYIDVVFPLIDLLNWEDPEVEKITGQIQTIYKTAKAIGIKVGLEVVPNQDFVNYREEFRAARNNDPLHRRADNGNNICPSKEGAMEYILAETYGRVFRYLKEKGVVMDFLCFWPYDEGGCSCEKCFPWGANGFLKSSRAIYEVAKTYLPEVMVILSTWLFDTPHEGEWEGLDRALAAGNDWVDYIMADSHDDFPEYPLKNGVPGHLPLINYPEISMWGLHPWGGYGANPLPDRFERLWNQVKDTVSGGIAYSEGIFDDVNKIVVSQFYWNKDTTARDTLIEYISYEYSHKAVDEVLEIIRLIEMNQTITADGIHGTYANTRADLEAARTALELAQRVDLGLPEWVKSTWRWRILVLRAVLDLERYMRAVEQRDKLTPKTRWTDVLKGSKTAKAAMEEIALIFHSNMNYDDRIHPMYRHVRPALKEI